MNDRQENTRGTDSHPLLQMSLSDESSKPSAKDRPLREARKIGQREAMYLYAERRVLDAVQVEFYA